MKEDLNSLLQAFTGMVDTLNKVAQTKAAEAQQKAKEAEEAKGDSQLASEEAAKAQAITEKILKQIT